MWWRKCFEPRTSSTSFRNTHQHSMHPLNLRHIAQLNIYFSSSLSLPASRKHPYLHPLYVIKNLGWLQMRSLSDVYRTISELDNILRVEMLVVTSAFTASKLARKMRGTELTASVAESAKKKAEPLQLFRLTSLGKKKKRPTNFLVPRSGGLILFTFTTINRKFLSFSYIKL